MTQNNNNLVTRNNDPEQIDLLDLVLQLWRGKWVIGAFVYRSRLCLHHCC